MLWEQIVRRLIFKERFRNLGVLLISIKGMVYLELVELCIFDVDQVYYC